MGWAASSPASAPSREYLQQNTLAIRQPVAGVIPKLVVTLLTVAEHAGNLAICRGVDSSIYHGIVAPIMKNHVNRILQTLHRIAGE